MNEGLQSDGARSRFFLLRSLATLAPLDDAAIAMLAEHARPRRFRAGDVMIAADQPVRAVYLVLEGAVELRQGEARFPMGRGGGVGFQTLITRMTGVSAVATADSRTLEIPAAVILDAFEEDFAFMRNGLRLAAGAVLRQRGGLPADPRRQGEVDAGEPRPSLGFTERLLELRKVPIFGNTNLGGIVEIVRCSVEVRGRAGDRLWTAGASADHWIQVLWGKIRCIAPDGREVVVGADYTLGVMDSLAAQPRSFTATAEADWCGYRIDHEAVLSVLETHFELARDFQAVLVGMIVADQAAARP